MKLASPPPPLLLLSYINVLALATCCEMFTVCHDWDLLECDAVQFAGETSPVVFNNQQNIYNCTD